LGGRGSGVTGGGCSGVCGVELSDTAKVTSAGTLRRADGEVVFVHSVGQLFYRITGAVLTSANNIATILRISVTQPASGVDDRLSVDLSGVF